MWPQTYRYQEWKMWTKTGRYVQYIKTRNEAHRPSYINLPWIFFLNFLLHHTSTLRKRFLHNLIPTDHMASMHSIFCAHVMVLIRNLVGNARTFVGRGVLFIHSLCMGTLQTFDAGRRMALSNESTGRVQMDVVPSAGWDMAQSSASGGIDVMMLARWRLFLVS